MKTRLYDSELGRFLSKDQVSGGGSALDFNPYLYCNNNPISRIDPSGKGWWSKVTNFVSSAYQVVKKGLTTAYKAAVAIDKKIRNYVNEHIVYPIVRGPVGDFAEWATANPVRLAAVSLGIGVAAIAVGAAIVGGIAAVQAAITAVAALGTYAAVATGAGSTAFLTNACAQSVYQAALRNTPDQTALIELAKMEQMKGGTDIQTAQTLVGWAQEYGVPYAEHLAGHVNRGTLPHIEIGPVNHIFVSIVDLIK